jgi:hypothetical protein
MRHDKKNVYLVALIGLQNPNGSLRERIFRHGPADQEDKHRQPT